ncbi:MAG: hypothetical protein WDO19_14885 [Bacteroidota bacterium]
MKNCKKFELGADMIAVYVPQAYNFAGQLYLLPRDRVKPVENINSGQIMKYAVTGGVADLDEDFNGAEKIKWGFRNCLDLIEKIFIFRYLNHIDHRDIE